MEKRQETPSPTPTTANVMKPHVKKHINSRELCIRARVEMPPDDSIFICHASEDKEPFVRELANALIDKGLRVWYDDFSLTLGDSLRSKIDQGLANCRYGIVVLVRLFSKRNGHKRNSMVLWLKKQAPIRSYFQFGTVLPRNEYYTFRQF